MKLLFVAFCAPRPHAPMMGSFVHQMAAALVRAGHDVDVLVPVRIFPDRQLLKALLCPRQWCHLGIRFMDWRSKWAGARGCCVRDGVQYVYRRFWSMPGTRRRGANAQSFMAAHSTWLMTRFGRESYHLVLGHFVSTGPLVAHLAKVTSGRSALYVHEEFDPGSASAEDSVLLSNLHAVPLLLTNSMRSRKRLVQVARKDQGVLVVHLGLGPQFQAPAPSFPDSGCLNLVYVSRFEERKNHALLVHVVDRWNRKNDGRDSLALELVGDRGSTRSGVAQLIKDLSLEDSVRILSASGYDVIRDSLLRAHLFVFPSRFESFGIVGLEAAALGLPVIAGESVGFVEELAENGWTIPTFDVDRVDACLEAIQMARQEYTTRREYAGALRAWVLETFSWDKTANELLSCVEGTV